MPNIPLSLTPAQAKILFGVVDGAADAGACEGGNTEQEAEALSEISHKLLKHHHKWKEVELDKG